MSGKKQQVLLDRPDITHDLVPLYETFWSLSQGRSYSGGSPLPITMGEYAAFLQIRPMRSCDDRIAFVDLMQALDSAWLNYKFEQMPKPK